LILSELNLKDIEYTSDEAQYVNLSVKPNLRTLGKRLGPDLNKVRGELMKLNEDPKSCASFLAVLEAQGSAQVCGFDIAYEDVLIDRSPKDDRLIATESGVTVLLDTTLTPDLIEEGLSREVVNRVQNFRKDSGLQVTDKILLSFAGDDAIITAIKKHKNHIASETLCDDLMVGESVADGAFMLDVDLDGKVLKVWMRKVES
jgi:isoleucyl-tRNA synthetase